MTPAAAVLRGRRVLVVEDDYRIARNILGLLQAAGATVMGSMGRVAQAVRFVRDRFAEVGSAALDLDLHGQPSWPVAEALIGAGCPFVFTPGFGAGNIAPAFAAQPCCRKPGNGAALLGLLARLPDGEADGASDGAAGE